MSVSAATAMTKVASAPKPTEPTEPTEPTATPVVVTFDAITLSLVDEANEAVAYYQTFGPLVQDKATLTNALAILTRYGHATEDDANGENDTANLMREVIQSIDTATATVAQTIARAAYATVVQRCKAKGYEGTPDTLKTLQGNEDTDGKIQRLKGYSFSLTANGKTVTYANIGDLAKALDHKADAHRKAAHEAGSDRPDMFTYTVDGIMVTASKTAA